MVQRMVSAEALVLIEQQLQQQRTHFTLTEAAALTGLAIDEAREALDVCLKKYLCRLQVSEHGDLIYNFGETIRRRDAKTFGEWIHEVGRWLWKIFTVVYKAWIAVTLVVYFVIFLVLLIIMILAASSRRSTDDRRTSASTSLDLGALLHLFSAIFRWRTVTETIDYTQDRDGYRYRQYQSTPGIINAQKKSFIAAVYDFVFGSPRVTPDPLQHEKEAAAYLRRHKGVIVAAELCALAGWTFPQAETALTDCVIRYQGDTKISDQAVLYSQFDTITRSVGAAEDEAIVYYWDEYEPAYELTGNSAGSNGLIAGMNCFNGLFAWLVLRGAFDALLQPVSQRALATASMPQNGWMYLLLGWLPLLFSLLFFVIPLGRFIRLQALRRRRHMHNIRKRLFKAIFARQGQAQTIQDIMAIANTDAPEEALSAQLVEEMMKTLSLDMPGEMLVNDAAQVQFAFPRVTQELHEIEQIRRQRRSDEGLGEIVVESDNQ